MRWDCRKREDDLMVKAVECCLGELYSIPTSATEFLCDAGCITEIKLFTAGH